MFLYLDFDTNWLNSRSSNSDKQGHHKPPQNIIVYCNFRKLRHLSLIRLITAGSASRGRGWADRPPPPPSDTTGYGQRGAGTHPTGMHSCCSIKTCEETGLVPYRSLWKIHSLKYKTHRRWHLYDLSRHEAQFLVVVQYSVHVLNPHGVDRPIEDDPFPVWSVRRSKFTERHSCYTIRPLKYKIKDIRHEPK